MLAKLSLKKVDTSQLVDRLMEVPLFQKCEESQLEKLARYMKESTFGPREWLMKQNEYGTRFYIIIDGLCDVIIDGKTVGKLTEGDYCGELALIQNSNRTASIQAIKPTRVFWIDKKTFKRILQNDLEISFFRRGVVHGTRMDDTAVVNSESAFSSSSDNQSIKQKKTHPSQAEVRWLLQSVQSNVLFRHLTASERRYIVQQMWKEEVKKGDVLIKEGDTNGDRFHVIRSGRFKITQKSKGLLRYVSTKDCVGELALIYNAPRSASVTCLSPSAIVWTIDRNTLRYHVKELTETKTNTTIKFLKKVPLLSSLLSHEFTKLANGIHTEHFEEGQTIISQGQIGDKFYLIHSGKVAVYNSEESLSNCEPTRILEDGSFFGERALLTKEPRSATIIAEYGDVTLYTLSKKMFESMIGPLEVIMKRHMDDHYKDESLNKDTMDQKEQEEDCDEYHQNSTENKKKYKLLKVTKELNQLKILGDIGVGGYGVVQMIREPNTKKMFALKSVRKDLIVRNKQTRQIQDELRIMRTLSGVNNPFIINLHQSYQDDYRVYFLVDLAQGGDLFHFMREHHTSLSKTQVRFYSACIVEALSFIHSFNIIYRDIKPENMIISHNGYLKLADFGLSKRLQNGENKTYTVCGTPDYLAPDIILGRGYDKADRIADKILSSKPKFNYQFDHDSRAIITDLLQKNPRDRLGSLSGADQIRAHPFYKDFDFNGLRSESMPPPTMPKISNETDMSNFKITLNPDPSQPRKVTAAPWAKEF